MKNQEIQYRSNLLLLLYNYIWTLIIAIGIGSILLLLINIFFPLGDSAFTIGLIAIIILSFLYSVWGGYCTIKITDEDVLINVLFKGKITFPREYFNFSTYVSVHSINFLPVQKFRYLIIYNDSEEYKVGLPNISKRKFDLLAAILVKIPKNTVNTIADDEVKIFNVPKEEMLKKHRKVLKIYTIVSCIISLGIIGFAFYKSMYGSAEAQTIMREKDTVLWTVVFCLLMFNMPILAILMEHRKRKKETPATVTVKNDCILFDEKQYPMTEIKRITVTPPTYRADLPAKFRKLIIQTNKGKINYRFGALGNGEQIDSAIFADYGNMCEEIERQASVNSFLFVRDL